jgi:ABC-2 type transport system permease protein
MRKVWVIAAREYNAAVRTKAFLFSLLIPPLLMSGSLLVEMVTRNTPPTEERHYAVLDPTEGAVVFHFLKKQLGESGMEKQLGKVSFEQVPLADTTPQAIDQARREALEKVRGGILIGFIEVPRDIFELPRQEPGAPHSYAPLVISYRTNRLMDPFFVQTVEEVIKAQVRQKRGEHFKLGPDDVKRLTAAIEVLPVSAERDPKDKDTSRESVKEKQIAAVLVPAMLMMLMFVVVMMTSTPLMQAVVEEKMQRIAEVLLGSMRPFPLMLGKLLGMTGVSLTMSAVYLGGAWWAASHFGYAHLVGPKLLVWFVVFQALSALMFGSLFIAVGAAASDMKETQSLLWPIMLVVCIPFFLMPKVIHDPNGTLITSMSFFPFATPALMVGRLGVPNGVDPWQLYVGVAVVLATTLLCVWAAGRIFRIGILMQGKGARLGDLARWVLRG